jgi:hypothetical protein
MIVRGPTGEGKIHARFKTGFPPERDLGMILTILERE